MRLSKNFYLSEFTKSNVASRLGINNTPGPQEVSNLQDLVDAVAQPVRDWAKRPCIITSGYRCLDLNRALRSSDTSQHTLGQAMDHEVPGVSNYDLAKFIRDNLSFDQLILEFYERGNPNSGWVHVSYVSPERNRHEILTAEKGGIYRHGLHY